MVGGVRDGRGHQETYPWQPRAASSGDRETRSENNERVYIMYCTQQVLILISSMIVVIF